MAYGMKPQEPVLTDEEIIEELKQICSNNEYALQHMPSPRMVRLVRETKCQLCTDNELILYFYKCLVSRLDPVLGSVEFIKYDKNKEAVSFYGKRGALTIASRNPHFAGIYTRLKWVNPNVITAENLPSGPEGKVTYSTVDLGTNNKPILYAECIVVRDDNPVPFVSSVRLSEYNTGSPIWASKPETMLKKVAIMQALEMAFPADFANGYAPEEFGYVENMVRTPAKVISDVSKQIYAELPSYALPEGADADQKYISEVGAMPKRAKNVKFVDDTKQQWKKVSKTAEDIMLEYEEREEDQTEREDMVEKESGETDEETFVEKQTSPLF